MRREDAYSQSELILGVVAAVGTPLDDFEQILKTALKKHSYQFEPVHISKVVIASLDLKTEIDDTTEYKRIQTSMEAGNEARSTRASHDTLALGAAAYIRKQRESIDLQVRPRTCYLLRSLKHPEEVHRLRTIYGPGFYLIALHANRDDRIAHLTVRHGMEPKQAIELIERDEDEELGHGQHTRDTFQLADFFLVHDAKDSQYAAEVTRVLGLLFGDHRITPRPAEHAMFMAFAAATKSGELSRQVGAAIVQGRDVIAVGSNEVPRAGGGPYWEGDLDDARDLRRGQDSNKEVKREIVESITTAFSMRSCLRQMLSAALPEPVEDADKRVTDLIEDLNDVLGRHVTTAGGVTTSATDIEAGARNAVAAAANGSILADITEYGRAVHAEMQALITCARQGISTHAATLYCTTFPCHNCAKHMVAAGISTVVYIEPYPKSRALTLHCDSIQLSDPDAPELGEPATEATRVRFQPFVGVGPHRFLDLFSLRGGAGYELMRQDGERAREWHSETDAVLRTPLVPDTYLKKEEEAAQEIAPLRKEELGQ